MWLDVDRVGETIGVFTDRWETVGVRRALAGFATCCAFSLAGDFATCCAFFWAFSKIIFFSTFFVEVALDEFALMDANVFLGVSLKVAFGGFGVF